MSVTYKHGLRMSPSISAVFFTLLPKCPMCFAILLAPLGISLPASGTLFVLGGWLLLAVPVFILYLMAKGKGRMGPLLIGACGAFFMGFGRFAASSNLLMVGGAGVLVVGFLWATFQSSCELTQCGEVAAHSPKRELPNG